MSSEATLSESPEPAVPSVVEDQVKEEAPAVDAVAPVAVAAAAAVAAVDVADTADVTVSVADAPQDSAKDDAADGGFGVPSRVDHACSRSARERLGARCD